MLSVSCYKGTRNYRKMIILWSFSYNSFVKFRDKKLWKPQHDYIQISVIMRCVIKGMHRMCSHNPVLYGVGYLWRLINETENILIIRFCFINFSNYVTQISTER